MGVRQIPILENQARIACKNFLWLVCRRSFGRIDGWVVGGWIYSRSVFLYVQAISAWISGIGSARFVGGLTPLWCLSTPQVFIDPHWFSQKYIADPPLVLPQIEYWVSGFHLYPSGSLAAVGLPDIAWKSLIKCGVCFVSGGIHLLALTSIPWIDLGTLSREVTPTCIGLASTFIDTPMVQPTPLDRNPW